MNRLKGLGIGVLMVTAAISVVSAAAAAEPKVIATQKTKDAVVAIMSETGQWKQGKNTFVLEFKSPADNRPLDVGKVALSTSMAMPGMAPMIGGATLTPATPGRYTGTIDFPDSGVRQVTVTWDGPAGKGSTKFSVPVR